MSTQQQYEQVAADLIEKIRVGVYPPGTVLPSRAKLREIYGCSGSVIDKAMLILRMGGWTETQPGVAVLVANPLPSGSP